MSKSILIVAMVATILLLMFTSSAEAASRVQNFYMPDEANLRRIHHTHLFRSQTWYILRRAEAITFNVQLDSPLKDGQSMSFQIAPYSIIDNNSIKLNHVSAGTYTIQATLLPDAPVGIFSIGLRLSDSTVVRQLPKQVAVLFNAWSPQTDEYFPRPAELSEYIEQEHGITYRGSTSQVQDVRWYFGVFAQETLTVTLYFVNRLNETERRDPALVVRHLTRSFAMQETVPDGLMEGKWEGGYGGGTSPNSWASSDQIFRTYIAQGFRTVRYAQCWVFGAVLLSALRTLGLASNQVSVMDSTHEYAAERTGIYMARIGRYFEQNYRYSVAESGKIWNFHSFNLVYLMNRHAEWPYNLPDWQVVDSTPQEFSYTGDYRLGPSPLKAIREGQKSVLYDTPFIIGEVSARHHSFLVSCQYGAFGGGQRLPPGCKVTRDLGASAHVASGTYIVAKAVNGFQQQAWTHMFHTRARSPAEDPSILHRFPAVRAFDVLRNDDPTGFSSLIMHPTPPAPTPAITSGDTELTSTPRIASTMSIVGEPGARRLAVSLINDSFEEYNDVSDKHIHEEESSNLLYKLHTEDEVDLESLNGPENEVALYQYEKTGVAMSIVIPPVELGKPLEVYLNFACESQTPSFKNQLGRKDLSTKVITLQVDAKKDKVITDDEDDSSTGAIDMSSKEPPTSPVDITECPSIAAISFHLDLQLTDYTTREIGKIAEIDGQIVLKQNNGYFESYRIIVNDYVGKALSQSKALSETIPEYVRAVVMATDHSTDAEKDIIMLAERKSMINMPKLMAKPSQTSFIIPRTTPAVALDTGNVLHTASHSEGSSTTSPTIPTSAVQPFPFKTNYPVQVFISYHNQLPFDLTNVQLSITADNLGFEPHLITIGSLKAGMKLAHTHSFNVFDAIDGLHFYHVVLISDQLTPSHAEIDFFIQ